MIVEIKAPELGPGETEVTIIQWHKGTNDFVKADEILVEIMTDKVNHEIESPVSGTILEILFVRDEVVKVGDVMARTEYERLK